MATYEDDKCKTMYIQITNRCDLRCRHCMFDCTDQGQDMNMNTFINCLELSKLHGVDQITIGGGEPTLHPQLIKFIKIILEQYDFQIAIISNGRNVHTTNQLIAMQKHYENLWRNHQTKYNRFLFRISSDEFHPKLVHNYPVESLRINPDRCIYTYMGRLVEHVNTGNYNPRRACIRKCEALAWPVILPDGTIKTCTCDHAPTFGNVNDRSCWDLKYGGEYKAFTCWMMYSLKMLDGRSLKVSQELDGLLCVRVGHITVQPNLEDGFDEELCFFVEDHPEIPNIAERLNQVVVRDVLKRRFSKRCKVRESLYRSIWWTHYQQTQLNLAIKRWDAKIEQECNHEEKSA